MRRPFYGWQSKDEAVYDMWENSIWRKVVVSWVFYNGTPAAYDIRKNTKTKRKRRMMVGGKR